MSINNAYDSSSTGLQSSGLQNPNLKKTQEMLAKHHGDGVVFAQLMKDTFEGRFNQQFWELWQQSIDPVLSGAPTLVDLGSGPGLLLHAWLERYPNASVYGVECAQYMLDAVGELPAAAQMITADLHNPNLALQDNSVDAVVASVVLHEMVQPVRTMLEVNRCLKPGGVFYVFDWVRAPLQDYLPDASIDVFDGQTDIQELDGLFAHFIEHNRFSKEDLEFMLQKTGFSIAQTDVRMNGRQAVLLATKT